MCGSAAVDWLRFMTGAEFLKRLERYGKGRDLAVTILAARGKGSHARVFLGDRSTTLKDRRKEIGKGLLAAMLRV